MVVGCKKRGTPAGLQPGWRLGSVLLLLLTACTAPTAQSTPDQTGFPSTVTAVPTGEAGPVSGTPPATPSVPLPATGATPFSPSPPATPTPPPLVPDFSHIIILVMENREFGSVIGNSNMPNYNRLAEENTLLSQYYAIRHPSLANYVAMIGGDTFGITVTCETCYIDAPSLPDLIEASGRTWRTYQEDMPRACFLGSTLKYAQKHNPFIYFDAIREDKKRCREGIVPLDELDKDLDEGNLPDFVFITPNLCNSGHDCASSVIDRWLGKWVPRILDSNAFDERSLLVLTWDEGQGNHTCCNLETGGGRVATVLISPLARPAFQDNTPYTHYSLLKTIAEAWGLEKLGHAASPDHVLITAPWLR